MNPNSETPGFDLFWEAYPRKVGKIAAKRNWQRGSIFGGEPIAPSDVPVILAALETWKLSRQWQGSLIYSASGYFFARTQMGKRARASIVDNTTRRTTPLRIVGKSGA